MAAGTARLFGRFALDLADATPPALGRKARALLAYLLLADGPVSRDRLAALLWSDRAEEQARASLRQALYELRPLSAGDRPMLEVSRSHVRLLPGTIVSDVESLRKRGDGADAAAVAALLGDPPRELLEDLDGLGESFDEWLASERTRRHEERSSIALAVARRALAGGDADAADLLAARLLAIEPYGEAATRLAMEARAQKGDRDGVRRAYTRYAEALRRELQLEPPPEMAALFDRLSAADMHRLPIDRGMQAGDGATVERENARAASPPRRSGSRRWWIGGAATAILLAGGVTALWLRPDAADARASMVVQPLRATAGDAAANALGNGLGSSIARMIVGTGSGIAIADASDPSADPGRADYLVTSDARTSGGDVHASIRLIDRSSGSILWSRSFARPAAEVDGLRDQLAAHLADVATCGFGGRHPGARSLDPDTMRLYLEACEEKHGDWAKDARLLGQVVQRQPDFAHAWAMLSAATISYAGEVPDGPPRSLLQQGAQEARRALALDPHDGEAYIGLAFSHLGIDRWPERQALLMKGRSVEPDNPILMIELAFELSEVGRAKEGTVLAVRGAELDPFNKWANEILVRYVGYGGELEQVQPLLDQAERFWPEDSDMPGLVFGILARVGDPAAAKKMLDDPRNPAALSSAEKRLWSLILAARVARTPVAVRAALDGIAEAAADGDSSELMNDAGLYAVLGRPDLALDTLFRIRRPPSSTRPLFYNYMRAVRADPRFMSAAAHLGLVRVWQRTGVWPDFCADEPLPYDCKQAASATAVAHS